MRASPVTVTLVSKGVQFGTFTARSDGTVDASRVAGRRSGSARAAVLRARRQDLDSRIRRRRAERRDGPAGGRSGACRGQGRRQHGDARRHGARRRARPARGTARDARGRGPGPGRHRQRDPAQPRRLPRVLPAQLLQAGAPTRSRRSRKARPDALRAASAATGCHVADLTIEPRPARRRRRDRSTTRSAASSTTCSRPRHRCSATVRRRHRVTRRSSSRSSSRSWSGTSSPTSSATTSVRTSTSATTTDRSAASS